jgi:hypothetical protein
MALMHLVESYIPEANSAFKIERRHISEADITKINKEHLSESTKIYLEKNNIADLSEKSVWKVPISRYDNENANGRVYEKRLWDRVIQEQTEAYQGNIGLADHPKAEDEGEFKEAAVVWLNLGLDENSKIVWGECIFVGPNGRLAEEVMEAGGRIGFSTSGFGELDESRAKYVRWDTYQLERPADIVLNPSQKVFGTSSMKVHKESITESNKKFNKDVDNKDSKNEESSKDIDDKKIKNNDEKQESIMNSSLKLDRYSVRKFNEDFENYFNTALAEKDLTKKLSDLEDLLEYFDITSNDPRILKINDAITNTNIAIGKAIHEHSKLVEDFGIDEVSKLEESVKTLAENTKYYEKTADEWKSLAEGLQDKVQKLMAILETRPTVEAYKVAVEFSEKLKNSFLTKEAVLIKKINQLESTIQKHIVIEEKLVKDLKANDVTINDLKENLNKYVEGYKAVKTKLNNINKAKIQEQTEKIEIEENKKKINIQPQGRMINKFKGFNESEEVSEYYEDLVARHGDDITPYEEDIKNCKTLREAMLIYNKALTRMGVDSTFKLTEALEPEDRKKLIESQTNSRIITKRNKLNLPQGWE